MGDYAAETAAGPDRLTGVKGRSREGKCRKCTVHPAVHAPVTCATPCLNHLQYSTHASPVKAAP